MQNCLTFLDSREMEIKTSISKHALYCRKNGYQDIDINSGGCGGTKEFFYIFDGKVNRYKCFDICTGIPQKM